MKLSSRTVLSAVLSAALLLGAAQPSTAQTSVRSHLAEGRGVYGSFVLRFVVDLLPNGTVQGFALARERGTDAFVLFHTTSAAYTGVGNDLAVAGTIVASANVPPECAPGRTAFFAIRDQGFESPIPDSIAGIGCVPQSLGNLTIQQILALIGPPPESDFHPLLAGDFRVLDQ